jgi:hypothetical protein
LLYQVWLASSATVISEAAACALHHNRPQSATLHTSTIGDQHQIIKIYSLLAVLPNIAVMPPSIPNSNGSDLPGDVPYGTWDSFPWEAFPEYAGSKSILYRSWDGII